MNWVVTANAGRAFDYSAVLYEGDSYEQALAALVQGSYEYNYVRLEYRVR